MEAEIPQAARLFFPSPEERPKEAPYGLLEKKSCNEELKWIARLASKNGIITHNTEPFDKYIEPQFLKKS